MDTLLSLLAFALSVFASFPLIRKIFKTEDILIQISITFVIGLSTILLPLYLVGILMTNGIIATSWVIFATSLVMFGVSFLVFSAPNIFEGLRGIRARISSLEAFDIAFIAAVIFLFAKYAYILSIKGIFDWDAVGGYLPFGQRIFQTDRIPANAYNFDAVINPSGISVLYSWIFSLGGDPYAENFRLMPIVFLFIIMLLTYGIGKDFGSKRIGKVAVMIFSFLPLNDALLYYASYYPDLCYVALTLTMFFLLYRGLTKHINKYYLFAGVAFGLSLLFKLQAFYFIPGLLFILIVLLKNRSVRFVLSYVSVLSLFFVFINFVWPDTNFFQSLPISDQIVALLVVFALTTFVIILTEKYLQKAQIRQLSVIRVLVPSLIFTTVAVSIALIWFLRNQLLTGSFVWGYKVASSIDRTWALQYLNSLNGVSPPSNTLISFLVLIAVLPFTLYFLGTIWIIPKIVGIVRHIRGNSAAILLAIWVVGYWIGYFFSTFHHFEVFSPNPRDFLVLAPFFSVFAALGLFAMVKQFGRGNSDSVILFVIVVFGLFSFTQSLFISNYGSKAFTNFFSLVMRPEFTSITLTSLPILLLIVAIASLLLLSPILMRAKSRSLLKKILPIILMFCLFLAPYLWITYTYSDGNLSAFGEKQLNPLYGGLFTEVANYLNIHGNNGDVVLMVDSLPLQYYLHKNITVLSLNSPGDLAEFRTAIESENTSYVFDTLNKLNVRYFLTPKSLTPIVSKLSNTSLLIDVVNDPRYFANAGEFSSWNLFERSGKGDNSLVKGWMDDSFSNWTFSKDSSNYNFSSEDGAMTVNVWGNNSVINLNYVEMPSLNVSQYPFIAFRIEGSSNALIQLRLYSQSGRLGVDFPGFSAPPKHWVVTTMNMNQTPLKNQVLDHSAILSIKSSDNNSAWVSISYYMIFRYSANYSR